MAYLRISYYTIGVKVRPSRVTDLGAEGFELRTYDAGCEGIVLGGRGRDGDGGASNIREADLCEIDLSSEDNYKQKAGI